MTAGRSRRRCDRCEKTGKHVCQPRAEHVVQVFRELLVHTKGRWARAPFILTPWQRDDIVVPLFGTSEWSSEHRRWIRSYRVAWIELAKKNGKSELLAGIALVLLACDDEEGAEVYGAARDRDQARKVFDVAARMVELSPTLRRRLRVHTQAKRIVYPKTASSYEVIASDAAGNLGHNPHGIIFDEIVSQPSRELWDALRTGMGTREQPLLVAATTASNDPESFCKVEHDYCARVVQRPSMDPRRFVYMRNVPDDADPWDESKWPLANPALGHFLSLEALRDEAREAKQDPPKENAFRQFRLNQYVQQVTRLIPLHLWDGCVRGAAPAGPAELEERAKGQRCFAGLDLSAKYDLTAMALVFPELQRFTLWRFWLPEDQVTALDKLTGGQVSPWVRAGWITATPGATIDYDAVYEQIDRDREAFRLVDVNYDPAMAAPVVRELEKRGYTAVQIAQGFRQDEPIKELLRLVRAGPTEFAHGGNPVARWNADSVEAKQDDRERYRLVKPRRGASGKRIDGIAALVMALDGVMRRGDVQQRSRVMRAY